VVERKCPLPTFPEEIKVLVFQTSLVYLLFSCIASETIHHVILCYKMNTNRRTPQMVDVKKGKSSN
jgi:hypothetical protein